MPDISILCVRVLFQIFICGLSPQPHVFNCVIQFHMQALNMTKYHLHEDFMKVMHYIALINDTGVNTQFENKSTNYTGSDISKQKFVLLPVNWDKKDLLFTKQLCMMI